MPPTASSASPDRSSTNSKHTGWSLSSNDRRGRSIDLPQGDPQLPEANIARRLLHSTIPVRQAYTATDGMPLVISTWFFWTGDGDIYVLPPLGIKRPGPTAAHPCAQTPDVAVTIDTEPQPPQVLLLRGQVSITEVDGMVPEQKITKRKQLHDLQTRARFSPSTPHRDRSVIIPRDLLAARFDGPARRAGCFA
jgi:hypothetical protein